jgi:tetratricopeptide (TPR) repeat protein
VETGSFGLSSQKATLYSLEFGQVQVAESHVSLRVRRILGIVHQNRHVEEYILEGIKILDELRLRPFSAQRYLFLGELYADRGQREKAQESLKKAEAMFQDMGMDYWLAKTQEVFARL